MKLRFISGLFQNPSGTDQLKKSLCLVFLCCLGVCIAAQEEDLPRKPLVQAPDGLNVDYLDIGFGVDFGFKNESLFNANNIRMDYRGGNFSAVADLSMSNDQKYAPARAMLPSGNLGGYYFLMNEGGLSYTLGSLSLQGGRFRLYDIVDSPYSLYINSLGHSANTLNLKYESPRFIYQSRWIELNSRSGISSPAWDEYHQRLEQEKPLTVDPTDPKNNYNQTEPPKNIGFPDRGANYKIYALKVNNWRLGFLDAAVYTGRSFDFEYFLNPIPQYFIQYVKGTPGRPWTTDSNENNMIGLFWDIDRKNEWSAYVQTMIDDFSLGFLKFLYDGFNDNPWKFAWALGGRIHTSYGRFGFHHGGALKYTFEPIGSPEGRHAGNDAMTAYGYTYYPETRYYDDEDSGKIVSILIEDNMLGYKNGENNIAFLVDYRNRFYNFLVNAELELSFTGNSSPANQWQDYARQSQAAGTHLFDDEKVETRLELRVNVSRQIGPWSFYAAAAIGGLFNKLALVSPESTLSWYDEYSGVGDKIWIWKPSNEHQFIFRFSLGARYTLGVL